VLNPLRHFIDSSVNWLAIEQGKINLVSFFVCSICMFNTQTASTETKKNRNKGLKFECLY
jgi:hypothetical protein